MESQESSVSVNVDDELEITRRVHVSRGTGVVTIGEELPPSFELLEGNNFEVFWKQENDAYLTLRYRVKCTKRGVYLFDRLHWECRHPMSMISTQMGSVEVGQELIVKPRNLKIKRIRQQKIFTKIPMPAESRIKIGVPTTDFKELRNYHFGDSYKQINWKATARKQGGSRSVPTVNEYEKEGRRVVFLFLDTSFSLGIGTSLRNSFEYAVQAVLGLSEFYIARQCKVGLSLFNSEKKRPRSSLANVDLKRVHLFPETGRVQQFRIHNMLLNTELSSSSLSLNQSVNHVKGYIRGTNPLFILVTRVHEENIDELMTGVRELSKYTRTRRQRPNVMILNVSGYSLSIHKQGDRTASQLLEHHENALINRLRSMGLNAVNWNPTKETVTQVLLAQVGRR
ncbi:MAG: DUF58 domain-containing protein [Candidatus Bathyarchaeota archaeon]|nr:DUF58 domain-containing protein [Candidatus Bathyarchaeota archaeon]